MLPAQGRAGLILSIDAYSYSVTGTREKGKKRLINLDYDKIQ